MPRSVPSVIAVSARLCGDLRARCRRDRRGPRRGGAEHPARPDVERAAGGPWIAEPPQLQRGVRLPAERVGEAAFWPPLERLDVAAMVPPEMAKREDAIAAEARRGDADRVAS